MDDSEQMKNQRSEGVGSDPYTVDVYEDNAGGLHLFALKDDDIVYAASFYDDDFRGITGPEICAQEYTALTATSLDPVAEGWESMDLDEARGTYEGFACWPIASTRPEYRDYQLGVDTDRLGVAGRMFADALGVIDHREQQTMGNPSARRTDAERAAGKRNQDGQHFEKQSARVL